MARHNKVGFMGEDLAVTWLSGHEFVIQDRNYRKKYGEIDVIALDKSQVLHFIEVKTVSYETKRELDNAVSHETWRPEEMVHLRKRVRLKRVIEVWLLEKGYGDKWEIDILTVRVVPREKYARIKLLKNVIFE